MIKRKLLHGLSVITATAILAAQIPVAAFADEPVQTESVIVMEDSDPSAETPEPEITPDPEQQNPEQQNPEQIEQNPVDDETSDAAEEEEEKKEVLPISTAISVSGEAGSVTLVLTVTNGTFINENIQDFTSVFSDVPAGVTISVAGQNENSVSYHISGNAAAYTKSDLVMVIPGNWLKNTADEDVASETAVDCQDYYWCAHADFGIRLKSKAGTTDNAAYIAQQNLTENKADYDTLHFVYRKTDKRFFAGKTDILEYPAEDARIVGNAQKDNAVYEIVNIQGGWVYVESGSVRGFVKKEQIVKSRKNKKSRRTTTAKALIPSAENKAYTYVRITATNHLIKENPRITLKDVEIKEELDSNSRTIGRVPKDGLVYWLSYEKDGWEYIESGDVRGFVKADDLLPVRETAERIKKDGPEGLAAAKKTVEPSENKAFYYKLTSTRTGDLEDFYREQIVELAKKYIGNPYVYGGTDPVHGIDCSAFMQFLFGTYGISLPRTSKSQGFTGKRIPMDSIDKGDMVIYADDAEIYHVVLYAGDGKTVEAANEAQGICSKDLNKAAAVWGISLLDNVTGFAMPSEIGKPAWSYETQEEYLKRTLCER
ncbi:MAG: C40 family peptidase [Lachnospiraceae bacterium]|nr:C40 family peptidase [Lachnospiraceae bacterium]